ncbi:MAG: hypothetical protein ACI9SC_000390, partial [Gammaproteobacteria bacterium]
FFQIKLSLSGGTRRGKILAALSVMKCYIINNFIHKFIL